MEEILQEILEQLKLINAKLGTRTTDSLPDVVTLSDIMNFLQVGRNKALEVMNERSLTKLQLGRKKGIPKTQFLNWWERQQRLQSIGIAK